MKSPSGFYSSLGLLILLNAVVKPLWIFAIDRQVQNVVGTETYGIYFSLFSLSVVLSFLIDWGLTAFFNQRLAAQEKKFTGLHGNFLLLKLLLALVYCLLLFIAAFIAGIRRWDILVYVALIQVFTSLFLFFRAIITAQQRFRADAWFSVIDKTLMILGCGLLLYIPSFAGSINIDRFLLLQTIFLGLTAIVAFFYLLKKGTRFDFHAWSRFPANDIFRQALPFAMIALLMAAHSRIDAFLLERIHVNGAYESGIYAASYRLLDAANICGYLVASFMLPYLARQWSEKAEINTVLLQCRHFLMMLATGLITTAVFLAPWIERVLYHHDDLYAVEVLQWCMPAIAGYYLIHLYGTVLTATGRIADFCYIVLAGLVVNCILNLLLIPDLGAKGCCIAALCSQFFTGLLVFLYARQKLGTWLHFRSLLIYIFTGTLLSVFFYVSSDWPVGRWILIAIAIVITVIVMILTRLAGFALLITSWKNKVHH
jgi:O-antigen/teichoic acid export membrane protein